MTIKSDEVPETTFAIRQYIDYCVGQIEASRSLIRKMKRRIKIGEEKLKERSEC